jgi:hypothetical protein
MSGLAGGRVAGATRQVGKKQKEKKADPFQNRKGRAPSLVEFYLWIEMIALAKFTSLEDKPRGFGWPPATQNRPSH